MSRPTAYELDHKIDVLQDIGVGKPNFQPLFTGLYAKKNGLSERLFYGASTTRSEDNATFIVRYTKERYEKIRPMMRVADNGDTKNFYEIIGTPVDIYDDRRWLKIHVQRNVRG